MYLNSTCKMLKATKSEIISHYICQSATLPLAHVHINKSLLEATTANSCA